VSSTTGNGCQQRISAESLVFHTLFRKHAPVVRQSLTFAHSDVSTSDSWLEYVKAKTKKSVFQVDNDVHEAVIIHPNPLAITTWNY
jgi:hypothetical protein